MGPGSLFGGATCHHANVAARYSQQLFRWAAKFRHDAHRLARRHDVILVRHQIENTSSHIPEVYALAP